MSLNDAYKWPWDTSQVYLPVLSELSGHVFVTLTTIIQSLFFYTKLEKMFMYITKSKRINTNILLTILQLMHFHLFYVAKYSGTYWQANCYIFLNNNDLLISKRFAQEIWSNEHVFACFFNM